MLCTYCGVNVRGTPCQSAKNAANCANNRGRETDDWGDDRISSFATQNQLHQNYNQFSEVLMKEIK